jgi:hypothetical protein
MKLAELTGSHGIIFVEDRLSKCVNKCIEDIRVRAACARAAWYTAGRGAVTCMCMCVYMYMCLCVGECGCGLHRA